jgi:hypothetical protein
MGRDKLKKALRVEMLHDHGRSAGAHREVDAGMRRRMIKRRRGEIGEPLSVSPELHQKSPQAQRLSRRLQRQRAQHALWPSRGARGIEHRSAEGFVVDRRCGEARGRFIEVEYAVAMAGPIDDQAELDIRAIGHRRERDVALRLRRDQHPGEAVVDDMGDFARRQERINAGVIEARSLARRATLDEPDVVLHEDGIVVEPLEADIAQKMRQPVAARLELAIGDGFARLRHDDGRLICARDCTQAWVQALPPNRED